MGLAEPKKRIKISHDPRNLTWSQSSSSYGQRLMAKQGWREGQSLGKRSSAHLGLTDTDRLAAAHVGILFKDDNLGLGAKRKSKDVEGQRTGLDAFQGLLGRLNGKSDVELKKEEQKIEDRRLAMYAHGRWGGMVFVKGGVLIGDRKGADEAGDEDTQAHMQTQPSIDMEEKARRKEEKRQRKEERRIRREEKAAKRAAKTAKRETNLASTGEDEADNSATDTLPVHKSPLVQAPDEPISSASSGNEEDNAASKTRGKRRRSSVSHADRELDGRKRPATSTLKMKNGRHLLRGRNIQAKRMAFSDTKGLDEIFMRTG